MNQMEWEFNNVMCIPVAECKEDKEYNAKNMHIILYGLKLVSCTIWLFYSFSVFLGCVASLSLGHSHYVGKIDLHLTTKMQQIPGMCLDSFWPVPDVYDKMMAGDITESNLFSLNTNSYKQ